MFGEYTSHNILIDLDTEYEGDLLSDAPAAEARVPPFHFDDRRDQFWARPFRARSSVASARTATDTYDSPRLGETSASVDGFSTMAERSSGEQDASDPRTDWR